jgi:hypothetical protein
MELPNNAVPTATETMQIPCVGRTLTPAIMAHARRSSSPTILANRFFAGDAPAAA